MIWRDTSMGFYHDGALHPWGDPLALLRFPGLSWVGKLRYGLHAFISTRRSDWSKLDQLRADQWLRRWLGDDTYSVCWEKLFQFKFFEYTDQLSAAWIWQRIKRIGTSRSSIFQEQLGHIAGGSETLIQALVEHIERMGGTIRLGTPVRRIDIRDGAVHGIVTDAGEEPFEAAISTIAIPYAIDMLGDLDSVLLDRYRALANIGVVCVVHKLAKCVTPHFWVNINDSRFDIPGVVEFSNLRNTGAEHVVYVPYYMPQTHPKFGWDDELFLEETRSYLQSLNPSLREDHFIAATVGRLRYAQPVCGPRFLEKLPPIQPGIDGLQVADTSYYYPEDRGISESVRLAKRLAEAVAP